MERFEFYRQRAEELAHLNSVLAALAWDQEVMMPPQGVEHRASLRSTVAAIYHQHLCDPQLGEALETLSEEERPPLEQAGIRELRRKRERAVRVPESLVREITEVCALAYEHWVQARLESRFSRFAPWLEKILVLKRQEAQCLAPEGAGYDALLDEFEPGATSAALRSSFSEIRPRLSGLLRRIQASAPAGRARSLDGEFPIEGQRQFGRRVLTAMGFDWTAGRLDESPHPFCVGITPRDVRLTTHYKVENLTRSLFGMIHEGGHGLYEQGLSALEYGNPACEATSLGIHESQSRLWENLVARSRAFWTFWFPELRRSLPRAFEHFDLDSFLLAVNRVAPTLIRIEADEVTYGLHIILRFELEQDLLAGNLEVAELPRVWDDRMEEYVGIRPANEANGVLQDTHWSQGLIGYFPTYLLGNMYAAQFFRRAGGEIPDLQEQISRGELQPLRQWLRTRIHCVGKTRSADELVREITGAPLRGEYFLNYLETKFAEIYEL
ncbi:MAG: carboxypeptidase M32 [Acidobacteriota bacterium]